MVQLRDYPKMLRKEELNLGESDIFRIIQWKFSFRINNPILLAHEAISFVGSRSGTNSFILGTAGAEYPRTSPIQKYDIDTHSASKAY